MRRIRVPQLRFGGVTALAWHWVQVLFASVGTASRPVRVESKQRSNPNYRAIWRGEDDTRPNPRCADFLDDASVPLWATGVCVLLAAAVCCSFPAVAQDATRIACRAVRSLRLSRCHPALALERVSR